MQPVVANGLDRKDFLSESAYDALRDGLPLVVRLLQGPLSREELASEPTVGALDLDRLLSRLERSGIVEREGELFRATGGWVQTERQEGMINALSQFFLPTLLRFATEPDAGLLLQLELPLSEAEQRTLWKDEVEVLLQELYDLSERPAVGTQALRLIVFGTSGVGAQEEDPFERAMQTLRRTARDRATEERKERVAFGLADGRYGEPELAFDALRRFAARLEEKGRQKADGPAYELVVGLMPPHTEGVSK